MSNPWAEPYKDLREMDAFAAGGGAAKIAKTGMSRDQVVALGNKNLKSYTKGLGISTKSATAQKLPGYSAAKPKPAVKPSPIFDIKNFNK